VAKGDDERVVEAGTGGALGRAAAGYLGGGPLNLADFGSTALPAAGIGAAAGLLVLRASLA
jgi:hypothetical protein